MLQISSSPFATYQEVATINLENTGVHNDLTLERREKMYTYNGGGVEIDTNFFYL